MAQPFPTAIRIVDGQGNWGSQDDPKSFAAMRYTESRLTRYAETLLSDWARARSTGSRTTTAASDEPAVLPAIAEPAAERHHRHRGRHGDRHPAAQPARGGRACIHLLDDRDDRPAG